MMRNCFFLLVLILQCPSIFGAAEFEPIPGHEFGVPEDGLVDPVLGDHGSRQVEDPVRENDPRDHLRDEALGTSIAGDDGLPIFAGDHEGAVPGDAPALVPHDIPGNLPEQPIGVLNPAPADGPVVTPDIQGGNDGQAVPASGGSLPAEPAQPALTLEEQAHAEALNNQFKRFDDIVTRLAGLEGTKSRTAFQMATLLESSLAKAEATLAVQPDGQRSYADQLAQHADENNDHDFMYKYERARKKLEFAVQIHRLANFSEVDRIVQMQDPENIRTEAQTLFGLTANGAIDPAKDLGTTDQANAFREFGRQLWQNADNPEMLLQLVNSERIAILDKMYENVLFLKDVESGEDQSAAKDWNSAEKNTLKQLGEVATPLIVEQSAALSELVAPMLQAMNEALVEQNVPQVLLQAGKVDDLLRQNKVLYMTLYKWANGRDPSARTYPDFMKIYDSSAKTYAEAFKKIQSVGALAEDQITGIKKLLIAAYNDKASQTIFENVQKNYPLLFIDEDTIDQLKALMQKEMQENQQKLNDIPEQMRIRYTGGVTESDLVRMIEIETTMPKRLVEEYNTILKGLEYAKQIGEIVQSKDYLQSLNVLKNKFDNTNNVMGEQGQNMLIALAEVAHIVDNVQATEQDRQEAQQILERISIQLRTLKNSSLYLQSAIEAYEKKSEPFVTGDEIVGAINKARVEFAKIKEQYVGVQETIQQLQQTLDLIKVRYVFSDPSFEMVVGNGQQGNDSFYTDLSNVLQRKWQDVTLEEGADPGVKDISTSRQLELLEEHLPEWQAAYDQLVTSAPESLPSERSYEGLEDQAAIANMKQEYQKLREEWQRLQNFKSLLLQADVLIKDFLVDEHASVEQYRTHGYEKSKVILENINHLLENPYLASEIAPLKQQFLEAQAILERNESTGDSGELLQEGIQKYLEAITPQERAERLAALKKICQQQDEIYHALYTIRSLGKQINDICGSFLTTISVDYAGDFSMVPGYDPAKPNNTDFGKALLELLNPKNMLEGTDPLTREARVQLGHYLLLYDLPAQVLPSADGKSTRYILDSLSQARMEARAQKFRFNVNGKELNSELFEQLARQWLQPLQNIQPVDLSLSALRTINKGYLEAKRNLEGSGSGGFPYRNIATDITSSEFARSAFLSYFGIKGEVQPPDESQIAIVLGYSNEISRSVGEIKSEVTGPLHAYLNDTVGELRDAVQTIDYLSSRLGLEGDAPSQLEPAHLQEKAGDLHAYSIGDLDYYIQRLDALFDRITGGRATPSLVGDGLPSDPTIDLWQYLLMGDLADVRIKLDMYTTARDREEKDQSVNDIISDLAENMQEVFDTVDSLYYKLHDPNQTLLWKERQMIQRFVRTAHIIDAIAEIAGEQNQSAERVRAQVEGTLAKLADPRFQVLIKNMTPAQSNQMQLEFLVGDDGIVVGTLRDLIPFSSVNEQLKGGFNLIDIPNYQTIVDSLPIFMDDLQVCLDKLNALSADQARDARVINYKKNINDALKVAQDLKKRLPQ